MARPKKSYLDLFLDNSENVKPKKKGNYFSDKDEQAILRYNTEGVPERERKDLFENTIQEAFGNIVDGVLSMPKFHHLPKSMNREHLIEEANIRLIEKIAKFTPGMIGKNGQPVKAFSYFSTIAKNFILEKKVRHEKILKNKADVETSIDLSILSEDTLKKMSNYDKMDINLDDYETTFNITRQVIINTIQEVITNEEKKNKKDSDFIKIGYCLKYLLEHWSKIEFMKKNEFMRILTLYTGLKQQQVSLLFKKFKNAVLEKIKPNRLNKVNKKKEEDIEEEIELDIEDIEEFNEDFSEEEELQEVEEEEVKSNRFKYGINTMEEFEMSLAFDYNDKVKIKRAKPKENEQQ